MMKGDEIAKPPCFVLPKSSIRYTADTERPRYRSATALFDSCSIHTRFTNLRARFTDG